MSTAVRNHPLFLDLLDAQRHTCVAGPHCRGIGRPITVENASQIVTQGRLRGIGCARCAHPGAQPHSPEWQAHLASIDIAALVTGLPAEGIAGLPRHASTIAILDIDNTDLTQLTAYDVPDGARARGTVVHRLYDLQDRRCALCRKPVQLGVDDWRRADCDHDNRLGDVAPIRGLLCRGCNSANRNDETVAILYFYSIRDRWTSYRRTPPAAALLGREVSYGDRYKRYD